jgi:rod shape-determining protein MreD
VSRAALRLGVVIVATVLLQTAVATALPVAGARIDLYLVLAISGGLVLGPERGAALGFTAGLLFDLDQAGPLGTAALIYMLAGYMVGTVQRSVVGEAAWAPIVGSAVTAAASVTAYAAVGIAAGHHDWLGGRLAVVILVVTASTALLTPVALRIMGWTQGESLGLPRPGGRTRRRGRPGRRRGSTLPIRSSRRW